MRSRRPSRLALPAIDVLSWAVGLSVGVATRYDWTLADVDRLPLGGTIVAAAAVHLTLGAGAGLYHRHRRPGSMDDVLVLAGVTLAVGVLVTVLDVLLPVPAVPRSVPLPAAVLALACAAGVRFVLRLWRERGIRRRSARRVVVFGAGECGRALIHSMVSGAEEGYCPVAVLDDDPALRRRRLCGVPVRGSHLAVAEVARLHRADLLLVAIRNVDPAVLGETTRLAAAVGLEVKIVPALRDRLASDLRVTDLRSLDVNSLLGRLPQETDLAAASAYLRGKRVLVTGAGGSIGSELCRQIALFAPAELVMLDRDESALHAVQLSIYGTALLDSPDVVLADLRDGATIDALFAERQPEVVFHAAALKHLPMLEQYPDEAWKTNVLGTATVLASARRHGVARVVNISTDKAANPTSVLGRSKRIGERLVAAETARADGVFLSVRFGNVLGSRGSVLTTFLEQIAAGGPVTVTHPDVTRFFMTIPEAVALVLQAGAIGRDGEALVLDMGDQVRITDVAAQLMELVGSTVPVVYTGLREGEKLHEELFGAGETDERPLHPALSHVPVPALEPTEVTADTPEDTAAAMARLCDGQESTPAVPSPRNGTRPLVLQGPWPAPGVLAPGSFAEGRRS